MTLFQGLKEETFALYAPEKCSSMVHNLPRMRNKETLVGLCTAAAVPLEHKLAGLVRAASDEIPNITNQKKVDAQWVYWFRDAAARQSLASLLSKTPLDENVIFHIAAQEKHVTLAMVMRHDSLFVGLRLPAGAVVDRRNLQQKLQQGWEREALLGLLRALPEAARIGPQNDEKACGAVDAETLRAYETTLGADAKTFTIGHTLPRGQAIELGVDLQAHITGWLEALLPLYRYVAWTRDNDLIEVGKRLQEEKAQKRRQATSYHNGDRVRFINGLFSGKTGIVTETDSKAQVRVQVGKMSVLVTGTDLILAPR